MRGMMFQALSLTALFTSMLTTGCPGPVGETDTELDDECSDGACLHTYACWVPYEPDGTPGEPASLILCDGRHINSLVQGFRQTCQSDDAVANEFCQDECVKAAKQNGRSDADIKIICAHAQAVADTDEFAAYQACFDNKEEVNTPADYGDSICEPPFPRIYCHGTADPSQPPGVDPFDFDETKLSYWREDWEIDTWHNTPVFYNFNSGCGYEVYTIAESENGPFDEDAVCKSWCYDVIDNDDGYSLANDGYEDNVRITRHNCESFVSGSFCAGPTAPPLVGPLSVPLTLSASLTSGTTATPVYTTFTGVIGYSAYDCAPGTATCPILIHSLSLDMTAALSGQWVSAAGSIPFTAQQLEVTLERPISGRITNQGAGFALRAGSVPLRVEGRASVGTAGTLQSISLSTHSGDELIGTIAGDGTLGISGTFSLAPGMTVSFAPLAPQ